MINRIGKAIIRFLKIRKQNSLTYMAWMGTIYLILPAYQTVKLRLLLLLAGARMYLLQIQIPKRAKKFQCMTK